MSKKISILLLCFMLSICSVFSVPVQVHATAVAPSVPLGREVNLEILRVLLGLLASGLVASGATDIDVDEVDAVYEAYLADMQNAVKEPTTAVPFYGSGFVLTDGSDVTFEDAINQIGVDVETPPDTGEELAPGVWGEYGMTLTEYYAMLYDEFHIGNGGSEPEPSPGPDTPSGQYYMLEAVQVEDDYWSYMDDFIKYLWDGFIDGLSPDDYYYPDINYDSFSIKESYYDYDENNSDFFITAVMEGTLTTRVINFSGSGYNYGLFYNCEQNNSSLYSCGYYSNGNVKTLSFSCSYTDYKADGSIVEGSGSADSVYTGGDNFFTTNLPVFSSKDAMIAFYRDGDVSGITNKAPIDYTYLLNTGVTGTMSFVSGKTVKPSAFSDFYTSAQTAYETEVVPNLTDDSSVNTPLYNQVMIDTATDVATNSEVAVTPPLPTASPGTDSGDEDVENYKVDLSEVFPFCLPFDFIRFIKVLKAEPVTPVFEFPFVVPSLGIDMVVTLDMSFLEDIMVIFRTGETVCFILFLISITPKMIKW